MTPQSPVSQTLYAQLLEEASIFNAVIFEQGIPGSPYLNHANGYAYWYWQVSGPDGKLKRLSLGRDTPETQALVERLKTRKTEAREAIAVLRTTTRAFVASGGMSMESAHFRVMEHLAQAALFRKGLVLVGSHAFTALGNLLGLRWGSPLKTSDRDFARALGISLALRGNAESIDVLATAKEFDPTFFAVPQLDHRQPSNCHHQPQNPHQARFPHHTHRSSDGYATLLCRPRYCRHPLALHGLPARRLPPSWASRWHLRFSNQLARSRPLRHPQAHHRPTTAR